MALSVDEYATHVERDTAHLLEVAAGCMATQVPGCPDWDVADLVDHVGGAHRFWAHVVRAGTTDPPDDYERPARPGADDELLAWARKQARSLVDSFEGLDPDQPLWNWTEGPQVAGFVPRRMAHETAVHRWDVESAAGHPAPLDPAFAVDGLDELLEVFLPASGDYTGAPGAMRLSVDDNGQGWELELRSPRPVVHGDVGRPVDVTLSGSASSLMLALWGRPTMTAVDIEGDVAVIEALRKHLDLT